MSRAARSAIVGLCGIVLVIVAIVYWVTPAGSLPHFFPGFAEGVAQKHFKHGLASFILALGLFAYTWFQTGAKSAR